MTDAATLLRAVIAAPDDDFPRLVLADWLDEHGEPERAEFIRVQCELAALPLVRPGEFAPRDFAPRYDALRRRERELWEANYRRWHTELSLPTVPQIDFPTRGFFCRLTCSWADWLPHADAVLAECPIRHAKDGLVELTGEPPVDRWPPEAFLAAAWPGVRFELPGYPAAT